MSKVIELQEVTLRLGGVEIFSEASATFEEGASYGVVGPNGAGKSVLFKLICGFVRPTSGSVRVAPEWLSPRRTYPDRFGIIINGPAYLASLSAVENLMELARIRGAIGLREVRSTLLRVGLDPDSKQRVRGFSLGMKQKLALAQALMENPDVLLLDEPFNALDAASRKRTKDIVRELQADGKTILFTSHDRTDIDELSHHVVAIEDRRLVSG